MKKLALLSIMVLTAISCREEEVQMFDRLDPNEQTAIRNMGTQQCTDKLTGIYKSWKTQSAAVFASSGYKRETGLKWTFKNASATEKTVEIKVWQQTPTAMYFYIVDDRENAGNYFLRITLEDNNEMIDDLLTAHCLRPEIYTSTNTSSSITMINEYPLENDVDEVYKDTYTMAFDKLAYFSRFQVGRNKTFRDDEGNETGTPVNYTSDALTAIAVNWNDDNNWEDYTKRFCDFTRPGSGYRFQKSRGLEGFELDVSTCVTGVPPVDWVGFDLN